MTICPLYFWLGEGKLETQGLLSMYYDGYCRNMEGRKKKQFSITDFQIYRGIKSQDKAQIQDLFLQKKGPERLQYVSQRKCIFSPFAQTRGKWATSSKQ